MEEQPRRVLGFPVDAGRHDQPSPPGGWLPGPVDRRWLRCLVHPVRALRGWARHRRLGPYDVDDGGPHR